MPWDLSKGQDGFLPFSEYVPFEDVKNPENLSLVLKINGEIRQNGNTKDMHYKIPKIVGKFYLNIKALIFFRILFVIYDA